MLTERARKELERIENGICAEDSRIGRRIADGFAGKARLWPYTIAIVISVMIWAATDTRELARRMFLSEHTVQDHLKAIFAKTSTRNRRTLLTRALGT